IANMHTSLGAQVLAQLPPDVQADVAMRIATMSETSPDVIKDVEEVIRRKLALVASQDYAAAGGVKGLADMLNSADRGTERNVIDTLAERDPQLAEEIRMLLFVFEDIIKLDGRSVVEEAQGRIVASIRRLEDAGAIIIARGDDEEAEDLV